MCRARVGALDLQLSEDDLAGIQRLADLQDGRFGEDHARAQRQAPVNLLAIFPRQDQQPARAEGFVDGFGDALSNPVEVWGVVFVDIKERKHRDGIRRQGER